MRGPEHRQIRGEDPVRDERVPEGDVVAYPPELAPLRDVEAQLLPDLPPDRCRRALPAVDRTAEEGPVSGRRDGRDVVAKLQRVAARNRQDGEGDRRWAPPRGRPRPTARPVDGALPRAIARGRPRDSRTGRDAARSLVLLAEAAAP